MTNLPVPFLVARSCTLVVGAERTTCALSDFRGQAAYVLLADAGAGKTQSFIQEAHETGGEYITARDFCELKPSDECKTYFIDGLDEMRAWDENAKSPLSKIREHLIILKPPRFRLSCRAADWLGASDTKNLQAVSADKTIVELHLNQLSESDVLAILQQHEQINDAEQFVANAVKHGVYDLLCSPQNLLMLMEAVRGNVWPQSRNEVYELACKQLIQEHNDEHPPSKIATEVMLDSAGYLCAIQLLANLVGFTHNTHPHSSAFHSISPIELHPVARLALPAVLKTKLFQGLALRSPAHRSIAEFLGARYLANAIKNEGLPLGRVLALITAADGGVFGDLRGLAAWLAQHCPSARKQLIQADPLGVVIYGDVKYFPVDDKLQILRGLHDEATRYTGFRDVNHTGHRFGALASKDMIEVVRQKLAAASRAAADQTVLYCLMDAIIHGEPMPTLMPELAAIVQDASYWLDVRSFALKARSHLAPDDTTYLLGLANTIREGKCEDKDNELLGDLLHAIYPKTISPEEILDFLVPEKNASFYGNYRSFWDRKFEHLTPDSALPILLGQFYDRKEALFLSDSCRKKQLIGKVLRRCITGYGDTSSDETLYAWLGVGLEQSGYRAVLEREEQSLLAQWFEARPARYKAILLHSIDHCRALPDRRARLQACEARLYGAKPPQDLPEWHLQKATEQADELARFHFEEALACLKKQGAQDHLTGENLEWLEPWLSAHPHFNEWLNPFVRCPLYQDENGTPGIEPPPYHWEYERGIQKHRDELKRKEKIAPILAEFKAHQATICDGSAPADVFYKLNFVYQGKWPEAHGDTPLARLNHFFTPDSEMVASVAEGYLRLLSRDPSPSANEIITAAANREMYLIGGAYLLGMEEFFNTSPTQALELNDYNLARLIAFHLVSNNGNTPAWFAHLIQERTELVASVLSPYIVKMLAAQRPYMNELGALAHNVIFAKLCPIVLPELLAGFPIPASSDQVRQSLGPILQAALHFLDCDVLGEVLKTKLTLPNLDNAQKIYWLSCGMLIAPTLYEKELADIITNNQERLNGLAEFFAMHSYRRAQQNWLLPISAIKFLIEVLGPNYSPEGACHANAGSEWETIELLRISINALGRSPAASATQILEALINLPAVAKWQQHLRAALHAQRIVRRNASFQAPNAIAISKVLANLAPASAADLAALAFEHLSDIAREISDGSTNYNQLFWNDPTNKDKRTPKLENECRDIVLFDLKKRLEKLAVVTERECLYKDNKRADMKVTYSNGQHQWNIPIEVKPYDKQDLWTAIGQQLIPRYVRDPETDGYGIYLVFWFGKLKGRNVKPPSIGNSPKNPTQLEEMLYAQLSCEERQHVQIRVIDCTLACHVSEM